MNLKRSGGTPQEHGLVLELLPWYAEGGLSQAERAQVGRHLEECAACRAELAQCQEVGGWFAARNEPDAWQPSAAHFERVLALVDAAEAAAPAREVSARRGWLDRLGEWLGGAPPAWRWALGVESLALAVLALALVMPRPLLGPGSLAGKDGAFETLTDAAPAAQAQGPRLRVVFAEEITEAEIRSLLRQVQGQVVQGPSALGVYTVELPAAALPAEAAQAFKAHLKVRLAEPVLTGNKP